jgi:hydrogenase nickel incorporation protein HypB
MLANQWQAIPVIQINTAGTCHLEANMIEKPDDLPLGEIDLLFIGNIGNLICTADFALASTKGNASSVPEEMMNLKVPLMFTEVDVMS